MRLQEEMWIVSTLMIRYFCSPDVIAGESSSNVVWTG